MDKNRFPEKTLTLSSTGEAVQTIGPYHLLQKIGEGGMGEVWVAEQHEPIQRRVALKLIKAGMDTRQVIARFESERQALALMDHPAIAKVFDAGETNDGRPYFVMEYVRGIPITAYCDKNRLTTRERLELLMQICEGVQHAHQKAIIHRDLKPSNILVAIQDGKAVPKIIDFGVAKATAQSLTERTIYTELGVLIGTPDYMSPEQAEMTGQNVDTRTDVYSLGAILYELLVGALPFDPKELRRAGFDEIRRKIRQEDPPKPSTRLSTMGEASTVPAQQRRTERPALIRQIRGDLDWITMKALEKDLTRRYGSASDLAADIRRHLDHQPVLAGPPSALYRARKFWQRHRVGITASAALLALLVAFSVITSVQAVRISRERDRANEEARAKEQIAGFLKQLFKVSDPSRARGETVTAREILDEGVKKIDGTLADQPALRAELMSEMGEVYETLGLFVDAERLKRQTLSLRQQVLGPGHLKTLAEMRSLAALLDIRFGREEEACKLLEEALAIARRSLGEGHDETLKIKGALANVLSGQRRHREAEALFLEVITARRRLSGEDHPSTLVAIGNLSGLYYDQGRYEDSARLDAEILEARRRTLGEDHPQTIEAMNNLAACLMTIERYDEARSVLDRAIGIGERVWGVTHPQFGLLLHTRGEIALAMGDLDTAKAYLARALSLYDERAYVAHRPLVLYQLAQVSARLGKAEQALDFLARALKEGYAPQGEDPTFIDDPQLASLRAHPRFQALASVARPSGEKRR